MTARKHFKQLVRTRMEKTGESYASARRQVLRQGLPDKPNNRVPWHFAGCVPATTALRVLLTHAGVRDPQTGAPFSEALLFALAGGVGIGSFSFYYEKEDFASFFLAGRHLWHDDLAYLSNACKRFGIEPVVHETAGAKGAEKALRSMLAEYGPCVAWVDAAHLPYRGLPAFASGSAYHVITVYSIDDGAGTALIGDRTDEPVSIALADLAMARARIKKQKHRLLAVPSSKSPGDLRPLIRDGLRACYRGLAGEGGVKSAATNFSLKTLQVWSQRLHGSKDNERWERVFARGSRLWQGLLFVYDCIEHQGSGGGLCRPLFAEGLTEAAKAISEPHLSEMAARYAELGRAWSALAQSALPENVPAFREARELLDRKCALGDSGGSLEDIRAAWARLAELRRGAKEHFPLSEAECSDLCGDLQTRVQAIYEGEVAAREALGQFIA
jgi:hypothetical protein